VFRFGPETAFGVSSLSSDLWLILEFQSECVCSNLNLVSELESKCLDSGPNLVFVSVGYVQIYGSFWNFSLNELFVTIPFDCAAFKRQNPALQGFSRGPSLFGLDSCRYTGRSSCSWHFKPTLIHSCLESRIQRVVTTTI
jgi:hypothetical protein